MKRIRVISCLVILLFAYNLPIRSIDKTKNLEVLADSARHLLGKSGFVPVNTAWMQLARDLNDSIQNKIEIICKDIYHAKNIIYTDKALGQLKNIENLGFSNLPICIAKTQYSFSADPKIYGAVNNFEFHIKDIVINNGAEMIVAIAGEILRMPGLPKEPQALHIDIVDGEIEGLS